MNNLLVCTDFAQELNKRQSSWRRIVSLCVASGIGNCFCFLEFWNYFMVDLFGVACPALSASLSYFDTYRRARLPANLTQV